MSEIELDRAALLQSFLDESSEGLDEMEQALLQIEARPADPEPLHVVFRIAHTLKGNAFTLGFQALGGFAHTLEDLLDKVREGAVQVTPPMVTALLRAVDALRLLVPNSVGGADALSAAEKALQDDLADPSRFAASAAAPIARSGPRERRSLRVDLEKLDRIVSLTSEIALARVRLGQILADGRAGPEALDLHRDIERLDRELHGQVMGVRAVRVAAALRPQERTVRDAVAACGKQARLVIEGEEVEADTSVVDGIRDPLAHMVRNAVVHGIESPEERAAAGKDPCGTVTVRALHESGSLVIRLEDDGRGFDRARFREEARRRGLPDDVDETRLFDLAFQPGFSTAAKITEVAGRGVGLDVVRSNVEALRGTISVESEEGRGTAFTLRLPLTLAILEGFPVSAGDSAYIVPMESVLECLDLPAEGPRGGEGGVVDLRGDALPFLRLRSALGVAGAPPRRECLVVVQHGRRRAGLVVDALHGVAQVVVRPLGGLLRDVSWLTGSAILGTGKVALLLDVEALLSRALRRGRAFEPPSPRALA